MATKLVKTGTVKVNGAELYHEVRGDGPPVVFITPGGGDCGSYERVAELLADAYTVVTYDRRGLSRSPRPEGWTATSVAEQAEDCAALIGALGLERPAVFGSSFGGTILVSLIERHAKLLRGAIVHEPGLDSAAPSAPQFAEEFLKVVMEGMADGSEEGIKRIVRFIGGEGVWDATSPDVRARLVANSDQVGGLELAAVQSFRPDAEALAAAGIPVHAARGEQTPHAALVEGAEWVSTTTGGPLHVLPGAHLVYMDRPAEFADALRPILASMT